VQLHASSPRYYNTRHSFFPVPWAVLRTFFWPGFPQCPHPRARFQHAVKHLHLFAIVTQTYHMSSELLQKHRTQHNVACCISRAREKKFLLTRPSERWTQCLSSLPPRRVETAAAQKAEHTVSYTGTRNIKHCMSQWSSGSILVRFKSLCGQKSVFSQKSLHDTQLWAWAAHWLQCPGRLILPPSEGR